MQDGAENHAHHFFLSMPPITSFWAW